MPFLHWHWSIAWNTSISQAIFIPCRAIFWPLIWPTRLWTTKIHKFWYQSCYDIKQGFCLNHNLGIYSFFASKLAGCNMLKLKDFAGLLWMHIHLCKVSMGLLTGSKHMSISDTKVGSRSIFPPCPIYSLESLHRHIAGFATELCRDQYQIPFQDVRFLSFWGPCHVTFLL